MDKLIHNADGTLVSDDPFCRVGQKVQTKNDRENNILGYVTLHPGIITKKVAKYNSERPAKSHVKVVWTRSDVNHKSEGSTIPVDRIECVDEWARPEDVRR